MNLSKEHKQFFHTNGFILLKNALSDEKLESLRHAFEDLFRTKRVGVKQNLFTLFAVNKGKEFLNLMDSDESFNFILDIMGPCIQLSSSHVLNRPVTNGFEGPMHSDGGPGMQAVVVGDTSLPIQVKIQYFLTDLEQENSGNFIMVPGTHRSVFPSYDPDWSKKAQIRQLKAKAGDAVIFSSSLWHGATHNHSGMERKSIIYGYSQLFVRPFDYQIAPEDLVAKCSARQKRLLGQLGTQRPNIFYYPPVDQVALMEGLLEENTTRDVVLRHGWFIVEDSERNLDLFEKYRLLEFVDEFEDFTPWDVLLKRAKERGGFLDNLLRNLF